MSPTAFHAEFDRLRLEGRDRRAAIDRFAWPTPDDEDWRFTDLAPIAERAFKVSTSPIPAHANLAEGPLKARQIAFHNGRFAPEHSTSRDLLKGSDRFGRLAPEANPFVALNTAFRSDVAHVTATEGAPIHLLFVAGGEGTANFPRVLIEVPKGVKATVVESYLGVGGGTLTAAVTEAYVEEGATLEYHKLQRENKDSYHVHVMNVHQARNAAFTSVSIALGAAIARNELQTNLEGEGADATLNGLYEVTGSQLVDNHTSIVHSVPHGTSRELYKGILDGRSRAVFDGRIVVGPAAQKTNAMQSNKNLLLSADALVNTKPQLEILANDVKCKHGATIGQLDRDMLFYMRSRGLGLEEARRLLIHAFASEVTDAVKHDAVRAQLQGCLLTMVR